MSKNKTTALKTKSKKKYTRYTKGHLIGRNIRFWIFWLILVGLIVWGLMTVHAYFDKCLVEYEAAQYTYVAEDFFNEVFAKKDFAKLYEYENCDTEYMESKQDYINYLTVLTANKEITYTQIQPENSDEVRYVVSADDKAFGQFTLKKVYEQVEDPETHEMKEQVKTYSFEVIPLIGYTVGVDIYEKGDIIMNTLHPVTYDYKIPSYAVITVNGKELGQEYIVSEETLFFEGHMPKNATVRDNYHLVSYRFTCALGEPEIRVTDPEGNNIELAAKGQDTYEYEFVYQDEELKSKCEGKALEFMKAWCLFSTHNGKKSTVLNMTVTGSKAYDFIDHYETTWITVADETEFGEYSSRHYVQLTDNVISCEFHIVYNTITKHKENTYETNCRLYFMRDGNNWKVYDFEFI